MALVVRVIQQVVPQYRVPFFEALARVPGIRLEVWASYGAAFGSLESVGPSTVFHAEHAPFRWLGPFYVQPRAMEAATQGECDVFVADWNSRYLSLTRVLKAARRAGRATLLWGHGFGKTIPALGDWLRDHAVRASDGVVFYGPTSRDLYARRGFAPEKLFMAPNSIDQSAIRAAKAHWQGDPDRLPAFRRERGLGDDPVMVFLSRLEADKRPDLLIRALPEIRSKAPGARVVYIGKGSQRDALETLARELGVAEAVTFAGAIFDEMQIAPWCLSSKLLVHPGGIGLTIFHAFGYGLPVITSDGMRAHGPEFEVHQPGTNGLLFRDGDAADLALQIVSLLSDESRRRQLAKGAAATVGAPGGRDIPTMVEGFADAVRAVAGRRSASKVRLGGP